MKIKECKKIDKYLVLVRELKKLWNIKVTLISIVVGATGTVPKSSEKRLGGIRDHRENSDHPDHSSLKIS